MNIKDNKITMLGLAIWLLAALFFLYEFFLRTFVGSVAQQIMHDLSLNAEKFSLIGSAYYLAYGAMQMPVGILVDRFGVKRILIFATLVCGAATFWFAHSMSFLSAFSSRLLMGFGSSFAFIALLVIAVNWFPKRFFGFFSGMSQFIGTMGPLLAGGPLIILMQATHVDWRTSLSYIALFGVVLAILILFVMRNKPRGAQNNTIYLTHEKPLLTRLKQLFKNPQAWVIALYSGGNYFSMALLGAIWGTQYLQVRGLTQAHAASIISLMWLGYAVGCPLAGVTSDLLKRRKVVLIACAVFGVLASSLITYVQLNLVLYCVVFFCLGLAASGQNVGFAAIAEHVGVDIRATALGMNNGMMEVFSASFPIIVGVLINQASHGDSKHLVASDFYVAFSVMPIAFTIALVLAIFFIKETYAKPQKEIIRLSYRS